MMNIHELRQFESVYKPSKEIAFCWLRKQYVQLSTEENHTEIVDHANDSLRIWQAAKAQAIADVESCQMKANEFVKKFGWDAAIDLWCGVFDLYNNGLQILNGLVCSYPDDQFLFDLVDLKRLVESHAMIEKDFESVKIAEYEYMVSGCYSEPYWIRIKQAIADVESCL